MSWMSAIQWASVPLRSARRYSAHGPVYSNALSVPLFDQHGHVTAAITTLGMAPHFDADTEGVAAQMLRRLGHELSRQLGAEAK